MHEGKLFTLYNVPSCKRKELVVRYLQQRRDQTEKQKRKIRQSKSNHLWQKWNDLKTEISKMQDPIKTVRSNLCRLIKESKMIFIQL